MADCVTYPGEDISGRSPYAADVGARYQVVTTRLNSRGVYLDLDNRVVSVIEVTSQGRGTGPEIAFAEPVTRGRCFTVTSVWRHTVIGASGVYYRIHWDDSDDTNPADRIPVTISLYDPDAPGGRLDPAFYRELPRNASCAALPEAEAK